MKKRSHIFNAWYSDARAAWVLGAVIISAALFYFYAINQTVQYVVERQDLKSEMASLNAEISELEFDYIKEKKNVDLSTARKLGYEQQTDATYINRRALGQRTPNGQL